MDEAKLRTQADTRLQKMRKEKAQLEAELETGKATLESAGKLLDQVKAMREYSLQADAMLQKSSDKEADLPTLPEFDEAAFEELHKTLVDEDK